MKSVAFFNRHSLLLLESKLHQKMFFCINHGSNDCVIWYELLVINGNGLYLNSTCLVLLSTQCMLRFASQHSQLHLLIRSKNHSYTDGRVTGRNLRFSIWLKDTSTCWLQGLQIKHQWSNWWTTTLPSEPQPLKFIILVNSTQLYCFGCVPLLSSNSFITAGHCFQ